MANLPVLIAGHSHVHSFGVPAKSADGLNQRISIESEPRFSGLTGKSPREQVYWQEVIKLARDHVVAIVWMGNQHNTRFMIPAGEPFDFVCSQRPDLSTDQSVRILPERAMREGFLPSLAGLSWLIKSIKKTGVATPIVVGTPPPKEDNDEIRAMLAKEAAFVRLAESLGANLATVRMSTPMLRLKLWTLLQHLMAETARREGARFCPTTPDVATPEGFLRKELWVRDATHANHQYGKVMFRAIERHLD